MTRFKLALVAGIGATAVALGGAVAPASAAERPTASTMLPNEVVAISPAAVPKPPKVGKCGKYYTITISGGRATVRECRPSKKKIQVNGRVTDTRPDGACAQVYVSYNVYRGTDRKEACGFGTTKNFKFKARKGTNAFIYLRLVNG